MSVEIDLSKGFLAIPFLFALVFFAGVINSLRNSHLVEDLPTSKTQGVFIGLTELKGTAESEAPVTSCLAGVSCVQYSWEVFEWSQSARGGSTWKIVACGGEYPPFYLQDDTGIIRIQPKGAITEGTTTFDTTCGPDDPLYFSKGASGNRLGLRRFIEKALLPHANLYVMGQARERDDMVAAEIAYDKKAPMFLISTHTEKQVRKNYSVYFRVYLALSLITALLGVAAAAKSGSTNVDPAHLWHPLATTIVIYLVSIPIVWTWVVYNSLIALKNRVVEAWSQVDVQLKRRNDLIPNLVACVEGYGAHEAFVQQMVAELRNQATAAILGTSIKGYSPALLALAERYPDLKASDPFLKLQQSFSETEQRIALARDYYNNIVTFYNTRLEIIPDRFLGMIARLSHKNLITAADLERAHVNVHMVS